MHDLPEATEQIGQLVLKLFSNLKFKHLFHITHHVLIVDLDSQPVVFQRNFFAINFTCKNQHVFEFGVIFEVMGVVAHGSKPVVHIFVDFVQVIESESLLQQSFVDDWRECDGESFALHQYFAHQTANKVQDLKVAVHSAGTSSVH